MELAEDPTGPVIEEIVQGEYWGRVPIVGRKGDFDVVAYFPTGRSPGSRARFLQLEDDGSIVVEPSDDAIPGSPFAKLIYYNAIQLLSDGGIVVTNGAQTDLIVDTYHQLRARGKDSVPTDLLRAAFNVPYMMDIFDPEMQTMQRIDITCFEPDHPNYTPRTSLVLDRKGRNSGMCLTFRGENGKPERRYIGTVATKTAVNPMFEIPLVDGQALALPTYTGRNVPSGEVIPHYDKDPMQIPIVGDTSEEFAIALYNSLGPKIKGEGVESPGKDFRVGVAAIFRNRVTGNLSYHVINANKRAPEELRTLCMGR
jgi:hypothetical protein